MALNKGTVPVEEIEGTRCRIIESEATRDRVDYLKDLLEFNGIPPIIAENSAGEDGTAPVTFKLGVPMLVFNPVIAVYEKKLRTRDGRLVTPAIWDQRENVPHLPYWVEGLNVSAIYQEEINQR